MAFVFNNIRAALRRHPMVGGLDSPSPSIAPDKNSYDPSVDDVLYIKNLLHSISSCPLELIDTIIDLAEYWPRTTTINSSRQTIRANTGNQFMLRSLPLGFVPGPDSELLGFGDPYNLTKPHPWQDPIKPPKDISEQVLHQLRSKFHPQGNHPCRKVVFTLRSHDQGWGDDLSNRGSYRSSYTWFDAGLEKLIAFGESDSSEAPFPQFRLTDPTPGIPQESGEAGVEPNPTIYSLRTILPETTITTDSTTLETSSQFHHPLLPDDTVLQKNVTCVRNMKEHVITWSYDDHIDPESKEANDLQLQGRGSATGSGDLVRGLVLGDVITVWAKSRFPGWMNVIEQVKIDLYWAV